MSQTMERVKGIRKNSKNKSRAGVHSAQLNIECPAAAEVQTVAVTRMTKQRAMILEELRGLTSHPTADEIYTLVRRKLPRISLGTVYRNLELLTETREILKLEYAGFQKRFDGNIHDHQHVRCVICGKVADVENLTETPRLPKDAQVPGFTVLSARVEFFGICKDCA